MTLHKLALAVVVLFLFAAGAQALDPCTLVSQADVQQSVGQKVAGPTPNKINPAVCDFKVGELGVLNFTTQPQRPGQTPDRIIAELKKRNIPATEAKGIGERAFFASPGYGMTQLNAFKGPNYIIVTLLIPGAPEAKQKTIAEALMQKALSKL